MNQNLAAQSNYEIWKTTRNLAILDILISTGIRIAELSNISINDIISAERVILIHGKGRKQRLIYISCPQTWSNLTQWLRIRKTRPTNTDKVFVNRYGEQISIHGIEYIYNTVRKARILTHILRRTISGTHSPPTCLQTVQIYAPFKSYWDIAALPQPKYILRLQQKGKSRC